ncbi:copper homeostasis protein CutC [Asaia krungthepensis]|uniref:PF03932 family protein CutC n=1 Tax=Asaia krungthepensis NRIC 0535 TaxID=1307925 RepID=A0ABQ0Q6I6_9PROT|nr:copper homeostasis protein CutC [Asaia krungthepensis]GBQ93667.1 copper homeostasis protein CutC [Asaia krungthepensis NRIC 0535]
MTDTDLEICVVNHAGLLAAQQDGVARIELCAALSLGGLTPSMGLITAARRSRVPVYVMIRPRGGNFIFSPAEVTQMLDDIAVVRDAGLAGVVLGAMTPAGALDMDVLRILTASCGPLRMQLHRVFDLIADPFAALEQAIDLGFERILTSGQAIRASEGTACLQALRRRAGERIGIMAGSGVRAENVAHIMQLTGVNSFHASCREPGAVQDERLDHFGFAAEHAAISIAAIIRLHEAICSAARENPL